MRSWLRDRADRAPERADGFASNRGVLPVETGRGQLAGVDEGSEPTGYHSNDFICEREFRNEEDQEQRMEQSDPGGTIGTRRAKDPVAAGFGTAGGTANAGGLHREYNAGHRGGESAERQGCGRPRLAA